MPSMDVRMDDDPLLALDPALTAALRTRWLVLMELAVWGDLKSDKLGALTRLRKRLLDVGERLRSVAADRSWIPQPRERLKNLLGSSINLRDALILVERATQDVTSGSDKDRFSEQFAALHAIIQTDLRERENEWATTLQTINKKALDDSAD